MADAASAAGGVVVCSYEAGGTRACRPALVRLLSGLAPDILVLHGGPRGLRWRSTAAAIARGAGLLYLDGGPPAGSPMLFVRMRVDTVATWVRRSPVSPGPPAGILGAVLRCGGQLIGVVGAHVPDEPRSRIAYGQAVLAAVGELRAATATVVVAVAGAGVDAASEARFAAAGLVSGGVAVVGARESAGGPNSADVGEPVGGPPRAPVDPGGIWIAAGAPLVASGAGDPWRPASVAGADLLVASSHRPRLVRLRSAGVP